nr:uncharacterized protein LOC109400348 isoform X1 [Aedes albopictus]
MHMQVQKSKSTVAPKIWKRDEILTFLDIFESTFHASVADPFDSEEDMWKCIADKLLTQGITVSVQQCINKWNILYKTYANNQNRQGVFYAKVKQIVEFSQELNDQQQESAQIVADEQVVEYDTEIPIKKELSNDDKQPEEIDTNLKDHQESHEHIEETIAGQEQVQEIIVSDIPDTQPDDQCDSSLETIDTEPCEKKIKLSDDACADVDLPDDSPGDKPAPAEENLNLRDMLQTILKKINAIQDEQISQGRRIASIEKRQDEHRSILLDIKKGMGFE